MKRKKKAKPCEENTLNSKNSKEGSKQMIFRHYYNEMKIKTTELKKSDTNLKDLDFYLFQSIRKKEYVRDMLFHLTYFYDMNFIGNKEFMHIPKINNIIDNALKYPIIMATKKNLYEADEILGACTIKYENNDSIHDNPYFPTCNETVLTITGILSKQEALDRKKNKIKGIGKELFKSAIRAAYKINQKEKIRLICEIDCRNYQSINSISRAIEDLQDEGLNANLILTGYYEIIKNNGDLTEAPTFILEVDFNNKETNNSKIEFDYIGCKSTDLYSEITSVIDTNTKERKEYINKKDGKIVIYHDLENINALNISLNVGNTAKGNDRIPGMNVLQYEVTNKF